MQLHQLTENIKMYYNAFGLNGNKKAFEKSVRGDIQEYIWGSGGKSFNQARYVELINLYHPDKYSEQAPTLKKIVIPFVNSVKDKYEPDLNDPETQVKSQLIAFSASFPVLVKLFWPLFRSIELMEQNLDNILPYKLRRAVKRAYSFFAELNYTIASGSGSIYIFAALYMLSGVAGVYSLAVYNLYESAFIGNNIAFLGIYGGLLAGFSLDDIENGRIPTSDQGYLYNVLINIPFERFNSLENTNKFSSYLNIAFSFTLGLVLSGITAFGLFKIAPWVAAINLIQFAVISLINMPILTAQLAKFIINSAVNLAVGLKNGVLKVLNWRPNFKLFSRKQGAVEYDEAACNQIEPTQINIEQFRLHKLERNELCAALQINPEGNLFDNLNELLESAAVVYDENGHVIQQSEQDVLVNKDRELGKQIQWLQAMQKARANNLTGPDHRPSLDNYRKFVANS